MDIILKLEDRGRHCILKKETVGRYMFKKIFLSAIALFLNDKF